MGTKTGIEWTDSTWSPVRFRVRADAAEVARAKGYESLVAIGEKMAGHVGSHCEHVSPGCQHCYAETNNHRRLPANGTGLPYDRRSRDLLEPFVDEKVLLQPLKWKPIVEHKPGCKRGFDEGNEYCGCSRPRRIFVENQSDLFGEWVTDEMLDRVFAIMAMCPQHIFQVLTKRARRKLDYFTGFKYLDVRGAFIGHQASPIHLKRTGSPVFEWSGLPMPNVWLGVSCENQATADERIPLLLKTPSQVRFISAEPLLGPIDLGNLPSASGIGRCLDALSNAGVDAGADIPTKLDWVIAGGESGPGARPMHPDWALSLRDQCVDSRTPFFFKQWGEWEPIRQMVDDEWDDGEMPLSADGRDCRGFEALIDDTTWLMRRVGKKAAGALLDGKEWHQFPEVTNAE